MLDDDNESSLTSEELGLAKVADKIHLYYPDLEGPEFTELVQAVYNHDEDVKLPPTQEMEAYMEADREEKNAKERKERLKPTIALQFKDLDHPIKGIRHSEQNRMNYNDEAFFGWVQSEYGQEMLERLRASKIDYNKFGELLALKEVSIPPTECYTEVTSDVVTVEYPKKRK